MASQGSSTSVAASALAWTSSSVPVSARRHRAVSLEPSAILGHGEEATFRIKVTTLIAGDKDDHPARRRDVPTRLIRSAALKFRCLCGGYSHKGDDVAMPTNVECVSECHDFRWLHGNADRPSLGYRVSERERLAVGRRPLEPVRPELRDEALERVASLARTDSLPAPESARRVRGNDERRAREQRWREQFVRRSFASFGAGLPHVKERARAVTRPGDQGDVPAHVHREARRGEQSYDG